MKNHKLKGWQDEYSEEIFDIISKTINTENTKELISHLRFKITDTKEFHKKVDSMLDTDGSKLRCWLVDNYYYFEVSIKQQVRDDKMGLFSFHRTIQMAQSMSYFDGLTASINELILHLEKPEEIKSNINTELIKQRKSQYGDNFKVIAENWTNYLNINIGIDNDLTIANVSKMMALMKNARIKAITCKLEDNKELETAQEYRDLEASLRDSIVDRDNYNWIADNFKEYLEL